MWTTRRKLSQIQHSSYISCISLIQGYWQESSMAVILVENILKMNQPHRQNVDTQRCGWKYGVKIPPHIFGVGFNVRLYFTHCTTNCGCLLWQPVWLNIMGERTCLLRSSFLDRLLKDYIVGQRNACKWVPHKYSSNIWVFGQSWQQPIWNDYLAVVCLTTVKLQFPSTYSRTYII